MARLTYYLNEGSVHGTNGEIELNNVEARYVFQRLKTHYQFNHRLEIWGTNKGRCDQIRVRVCFQPTLRVLVHEVAHAIQFKKRHLCPKKQRFHTKKHMRIMARIYKYLMPRLEGWKAMANKKSESHFVSVRKKEEKKQELEKAKKTPNFKLQQIERRISLWESKRNRAENAIKKLERKRNLWLRKLSQPSSVQPLSSHPAL